MNIFAGLLQAMLLAVPDSIGGGFFMIALTPHQLALTWDSPLFRVELDNGKQSSNHVRVCAALREAERRCTGDSD